MIFFKLCYLDGYFPFFCVFKLKHNKNLLNVDYSLKKTKPFMSRIKRAFSFVKNQHPAQRKAQAHS